MTSETTQTTPAPAASCGCDRIPHIVLLVSLLMMGLGNGLFLWNEIRAKTADVTLGKNLVADYKANNEPHIKDFVTSLQTFARSNPDFNPILAKYNLLPAAPAAQPAAPAQKK